LEFRARPVQSYFFYLNANNESGAYFKLKNIVPDSINDLLDRMNISEIVKRKPRYFYEVKLGGRLNKKVRAIVFNENKTIDYPNSDFNMLKSNFINPKRKNWIYNSNNKVYFIPTSLSTSIDQIFFWR
jgi:hypothetical protein